MALRPCRECNREVSTEAASCPHCGVPRPALRPAPPHAEPQTEPAARPPSWTWGILGFVVLGVAYSFVESARSPARQAPAPAALDAIGEPVGITVYAERETELYATPDTAGRYMLTLLAGDSLQIGSPLRNGWAPVYRPKGDTLWALFSNLSTLPPSPIAIDTWSWYRDSDFAGTGAVIWTAVVKNRSSDYVESVRVEFTSFDAAGRVVDTDWGIATGLAPGGTASAKGYATYFGTEKTASLRITPW